MKVNKMTEAECKVETQKHIEVVRKYILSFVDRLTTRGVEHDLAKLESPEVECLQNILLNLLQLLTVATHITNA